MAAHILLSFYILSKYYYMYLTVYCKFIHYFLFVPLSFLPTHVLSFSIYFIYISLTHSLSLSLSQVLTLTISLTNCNFICPFLSFSLISATTCSLILYLYISYLSHSLTLTISLSHIQTFLSVSL